MNKFFTLAACTLFLVMAGSAPVLGGERDGAVSKFCSRYNDFGLTHGACVAYFVAHNVVPHDASVCQDESIRSLLGVPSHGQCVKKLAEMAD